MTHVKDVLASIAEGKSGAMLIEWDTDPMMDGPRPVENPTAAIRLSRDHFEAHGWVLVPGKGQLEKDGWYIWYRSQGQLSPPIIQWGRSASL